jgi:hypothetical protein
MQTKYSIRADIDFSKLSETMPSNCCEQPLPAREFVLPREIRIQHGTRPSAHPIAGLGIVGE